MLMRILRGLSLFAVSVVLASCFDEPKYSTTPHIEFVGVSFKEGSVDDPTESLVITVAFRDGDGDLGLPGDAIEEPYHDLFYGLASNGQIIELGKKTEVSILPQFVHVPDGVTGKLVTVRTLQDRQYADNLPPFISEQESCTDYRLQKVYIQEKDKHIIDESYPDVEVLENVEGISRVYVVQDYFYFKRNPNHRNIDVEFYVNDGTGNYNLFDWEKQYCETAFDQRFPMLSDRAGALEGNLEYALSSVGIKATFGSKQLRLKIRIRDRALNVSNEVESAEFTLDSI